MNTKNTNEVYRIGHNIFRKLRNPVHVFSSSVGTGLTLTSESGHSIDVDGVTHATTVRGKLVMVAPSGAFLQHQEHGTMKIPAGTYEVGEVRDQHPEELRSRTWPGEASSPLQRQDLD